MAPHPTSLRLHGGRGGGGGGGGGGKIFEKNNTCVCVCVYIFELGHSTPTRDAKKVKHPSSALKQTTSKNHIGCCHLMSSNIL